MTTALQLRRGSTAQHATFTGLSGEITVDTTKKTVVVHDGVTAGGIPLATYAQSRVADSCTGNAATATTAAFATNAADADYAANAGGADLLKTQGNYVDTAAKLPNAYLNGMTLSHVQGSDGFASYGTLLTAKGYSAGGGTLQLYTPYSPTYGGKSLKVRFGNFDVSSGNSWTAWKTLLDTDSLGTGLSWDGTNLNCTVVAPVQSVNGLTGNVVITKGKQVFTSSGTFTVPAGVTTVKVTVVGGGAAGSYFAGASVVAGPSGGTSSFGAYCSATGGGATFGGIGSNGDLNIGGGTGDGFGGGSSHMGGGGRNGHMVGEGGYSATAGTTYGGGGGGSSSGGHDILTGGGGGGCAVKTITGLTPGATVSVTVGAGGASVYGVTGAGAAGVVLVEW